MATVSVARLNIDEAIFSLYALAQELHVAVFQEVALGMLQRISSVGEQPGAMSTDDRLPLAPLVVFLERHRKDMGFNAQPVETRSRGCVHADADAQGGAQTSKGWLIRHVMQALALNRAMHLQRVAGAAQTLSHCGWAIADAAGQLYHADATFHALARDEWTGWAGRSLPISLLGKLREGMETFNGSATVIRVYLDGGLLFMRARARCRFDHLTARERAIAQRIACGETHKEIAQAFERSPATIRNQIQTIYDKLQVTSIATLIEALRQGE
ncbi:MAG: helix-turn-helix transcriptional regulator [Rhodoferax sp.]|nr:helix-turn-helix transcriptional regulator [Rhodoferax sp.]